MRFRMIQMEPKQGTYSYNFANLKPIQYRCLACTIESENKDAHLSRADQAAKIADESTCNIILD